MNTPADSVLTAPGRCSVTWNLNRVADWEDFVFLDIARQARGWNYSNQAVTLRGNLDMSDVTGGGHSRSFFLGSRGSSAIGYSSRPTHRDGEYTILWDGGVGVSLVGFGGVSNIVETGAGVDHDGSARFSFSCFRGNTWIKFNNISAADPPTNIRIIKTENLADYAAGLKLDPLMVDLLKKGAYAIRFMDWMGTNHSSVANWDDYPDESWQRWERVPVSVMAALCNATNAHGWFCIPHQASDTFITTFAAALDTHMRPGLFADIEYSNEVWNSIFSQGSYAAARAKSEWGDETYQARLCWVGKRFVEVMDLTNAINPTRFRGMIGGVLGNFWSTRQILDAPVWKSKDPAAYVAPHSRATFVSCTDYIGWPKESEDWMAQFDAGWDAGNLQPARQALWAYLETKMPDVQASLHEHIDETDQRDSVDGLRRKLRFRTYEGGSNHINMTGDVFARWYKPLAWAPGIKVLEKEYRLNSHGRLYRAEAAGVTGTDEPVHMRQDSVSDGAIVWQDVTGLNSYLYRDVTGTLQGKPTLFPIMQWDSGVDFPLNAYVENSNGRIYRATQAGVSGGSQPVHTGGQKSDGGISWEAVVCGLGENNPRPEVAQWFRDVMYSPEMAGFNLRLWEFIKDQGGESPAVYNMSGRFSQHGAWGKFFHYADTGPDREGDIGDIFVHWSVANPAWWRD